MRETQKQYIDQGFRKEDAYLRAQKRLKELKGFYWHAFWYAVVNIFLIILITNTSSLSIWDFGVWSTAFFWGIGLGFHAIGVFGKRFAFSKKWEERKIQEFMEREERERRQLK